MGCRPLFRISATFLAEVASIASHPSASGDGDEPGRRYFEPAMAKDGFSCLPYLSSGCPTHGQSCGISAALIGEDDNRGSMSRFRLRGSGLVSNMRVSWASIAAIAGTLLAGPACAAPAAAAMEPVGVIRAAPYPPSPPSIAVNSSTVCQGCRDAVAVSGFMADSTVQFALSPASLGSAVAGSNGNAALSFQIPSGTTLGQHTLVGIGVSPAGTALTVSVTITVTSAPAAVSMSPAGYTHRSVSVLAPAGIAAAFLGAGGTLILRRRRASKTAKS